MLFYDFRCNPSLKKFVILNAAKDLLFLFAEILHCVQNDNTNNVILSVTKDLRDSTAVERQHTPRDSSLRSE